MKCIIRDAQAEDLMGIAKVKIDTWRSTYKGIISDEILAGFDLKEQAEKFKELLTGGSNGTFFIAAEADGVLVGFAAGGTERDGKYGIDGEVYAVYVLQEYQNRGVGRMLMECSAEKLAGMGFKSLLVWVLEDNPYRNFYEKHGGILIDKKQLELGGNKYCVTAYAWRDLSDSFFVVGACG